MKYLIVTTKRNIGSTKIIYPQNYKKLVENSIINANFYYNDKDDDDILKRLHVVPNSRYNEIKDFINNEYVEEITQKQAFELSETYQGGEFIEDEARVKRIEIKVKAGEKLTNEEKKALDINNNSVKGFAKIKTLKDNINKYKRIAKE